MYERELQKAIDAAVFAGKTIKKYYKKNLKVDHKSKDQPVTIADREANEEIKKILLGAFPDDGWLSEETRDDKSRLQKRRVWIVDPLDGTKEFIAGIPEFAVSIALVENGRPVVGVILNPATGVLFSAVKGQGATRNGQPVHVSSATQFSAAKILSSRSETGRGEWKPYEGMFTIVPTGGMAHKMVVVAEGTADASFSLSPKTEWDFAAGVLIVEEAGGKVTGLDGRPFFFNKENLRATGIIHSNTHLHESILKLISCAG